MIHNIIQNQFDFKFLVFPFKGVRWVGSQSLMENSINFCNPSLKNVSNSELRFGYLFLEGQSYIQENNPIYNVRQKELFKVNFTRTNMYKQHDTILPLASQQTSQLTARGRKLFAVNDSLVLYLSQYFIITINPQIINICVLAGRGKGSISLHWISQHIKSWAPARPRTR